MASTADEILGTASPQPGTDGAKAGIVQTIDRWIYVIMAAFFIATTLAGFAPSSIRKVMGVQLGLLPPLPAVLHVHAVLMGSWLLLLLTQAVLMARGKRAYHMQLGVAGMVLAPAMVATGFVLVPTMVQHNWQLIASAPPEALEWGAERTRMFLSSLVAAQIAAGALFAIFVAWAMAVRKSDFGTHKRLMILATAVPLAAAIDRMSWLPTSYPEGALSPMGWPVVWILPLFLWDLYRLRRVHKAYWIWGAFYLPVAVLVYNLWWTPGWMAFAQRLTGVA